MPEEKQTMENIPGCAHPYNIKILMEFAEYWSVSCGSIRKGRSESSHPLHTFGCQLLYCQMFLLSLKNLERASIPSYITLPLIITCPDRVTAIKVH